MLIAQGVGHRYGGRELFRDINLNIDSNDVLFIVGPSGMGKSTLLFILGGLLDPTSGTVHGRPDQIGWVLQDLSGLPRRSVLDNAELYAAIDDGPSEATRACARMAVADVGLADLATSRAATLSGGENQRLCVARALASNRRLILADEPTSQLDRENAQLVMSMLGAGASRGRSVVVVTHDLEAIPRRAPILHLSDGGLSRET